MVRLLVTALKEASYGAIVFLTPHYPFTLSVLRNIAKRDKKILLKCEKTKIFFLTNFGRTFFPDEQIKGEVKYQRRPTFLQALHPFSSSSITPSQFHHQPTGQLHVNVNK